MNKLTLATMALLTAVGCGPPKLDLVFAIPEAYSDSVQQVVMQIYQPRGAAAFGCEALAFGQVEEGVLRGSLVGEVVVRDDGILPLADIDRSSTKIFSVQGLDEDERAVVRGCGVVGDLSESASVTIQAEAVAFVRLIKSPDLSKTIGASLDGPITLGVRDAADQPLIQARVTWALEGVDGPASQGEATTDDMGEVSIRPALPARPGPFLLDVQVRWADPGPALVTGFMAPPLEVATLPGRVLEYRTGSIGPDGETGIVALLDTRGPGEVQVAFIYRAQGELIQTFSPRIGTTGARLGLFDFRQAQDRVVVVTRSKWFEVAPDGILTEKNYRPPVAATGALPKIVLSTGPCVANPDSPQLLVTYAANSVGFFDLEANLVGGFGNNLEVLATGCVDDQNGAPIRTLVIDGGAQAGLAVVGEVRPNEYVTRPWVAIGSGTAFSQPVGNAGRLLLGTQLNVNDFIVSRASWRREGETVQLQVEGLDSPPGVPVVNQGGDIDGDGALDVVSLFNVQTTPGTPVRWSLWAALGQTRRGQRLSGTYEFPADIEANPTLMVLDMDGDGVDDLIFAERIDPSAPLQADTRIEIYSMGLSVQ